MAQGPNFRSGRVGASGDARLRRDYLQHKYSPRPVEATQQRESSSDTDQSDEEVAPAFNAKHDKINDEREANQSPDDSDTAIEDSVDDSDVDAEDREEDGEGEMPNESLLVLPDGEGDGLFLGNLDGFTTVVEHTCSICMEIQGRTRKLDNCGHEFCEEGLHQLLSSDHAMRFNCPSCREWMLNVSRDKIMVDSEVEDFEAEEAEDEGEAHEEIEGESPEVDGEMEEGSDEEMENCSQENIEEDDAEATDVGSIKEPEIGDDAIGDVDLAEDHSEGRDLHSRTEGRYPCSHSDDGFEGQEPEVTSSTNDRVDGDSVGGDFYPADCSGEDEEVAELGGDSGSEFVYESDSVSEDQA
ncbi:uncharacterized protein BDR25DRAFT_311412 [Lindgomyces ingoldianus]|uniref:Uncharacterized protein n=1 Tax=Lindgomyces ingoldianus TaxID=673940 RepID=A0ACB6R7A0_9PLEO|nr:uncharacterized protein BDR25DRAFT_311412 [Lindgomyces ingoldianus]KAF2475046.1 hypothetical protein BDR25DRAFT_311412 [Lindgomyces ingoldianus]